MWLEGARWLQLAVFALWCLNVQHTAVNAGAQLELRRGRNEGRRSIPNHGFVRYDQISDYHNDNMRESDMYVVGATDFSKCCDYRHTTDNETIGWWFFPNGTEVPKIEMPEGKTWTVWSSRYKQINLWNRRRDGPMNASGIYHCDIPLSRDTNMTLYVGIYLGPDGGTGDPTMTSIQFSLASERTVSETLKFNVTCTSEGGPATTVTWTRDGEAVSGDNFTATRTLDDPVTAAYTLTLSVVGRQGGVYRCQVAKGGPGVSGYPVNSSMELTIHAANPPTSLTAVQVGNKTAQVSWTPPNTTSSEPVTGYQIYYMTQGTNGAHVIVIVSTPEAKQEMIYGLHVGLTYSITMVALSEHLPSELVGPVNVTILDKPAAPNVTTTEITTTSVLLQWTQSGGMIKQPDNFEISFQYTVGSQHVGFCSDYSHSDNITVTNVSTRQYILTGLQEHSAYRITIRAGNRAGKSAPSEVNITTLQTAPSGEPQEVMTVSITSHSITIQWREVPCLHQNSDITGYTVRYSIPGSTTKNTNVSDTVATLIELTSFTIYSIEVAAFSVNGTGPFSTPIYVETLQDTPGPVESLVATPTSDSILLYWSTPLMTNGIIIAYEVKYFPINSSDEQTFINTTDGESIELRRLIPGKVYSFMVRAYTSQGAGEWRQILHHVHPISSPFPSTTVTQEPQVDDAPAIIGGVFGGIGIVAIFVILIAVCIGIKLASYQKNTCDFAEIECVAYESARSDKLQACEDEVPVKQCAAYGVIQSTASNPENQAESVDQK